MKFKWQIPSRWLLYHLQGAPDVAIEVRIEMIHAFCVCVCFSEVLSSRIPKKQYIYSIPNNPESLLEVKGCYLQYISYNIIYKIIICICICKTNQGPLFNIPNSPGYKLYRVWSLMVLFGWKPTELFCGDLWIQLPHVTTEVFWQWRRWSVDHQQPRWRKGDFRSVGRVSIDEDGDLLPIVQCDSKK